MRYVVVIVSLLLWAGQSWCESIILKGAGATFPAPLYTHWILKYQQQSSNRLTYDAVGSSEGINRIRNKHVDFGASDAFLTEDKFPVGETILQIPTCLGAVAIVYNLPGALQVKLTPKVLSKIFLGKITHWRDPQIEQLNGHVTLPDLPIQIIHRSDGSGTTFIFTDYLSKIDSLWASEVGRGKLVDWPNGIGLNGNTSVTEFMHKIPGAIGYGELTSAQKAGLSIASIQNASGNFVLPTEESITKSALIPLPDDLCITLTNTSSPDGYPISGFTYLLVYKEQNYQNRTKQQALGLADFLLWTVEQGQQHMSQLWYSPLPENALQKTRNLIDSLTYDHKKLSY